MCLLGLIKLFEQKGLLITLVNMLIAQFGLKKLSIQFVPSYRCRQKTKS